MQRVFFLYSEYLLYATSTRYKTQDTRSLFPNPMTCILLCINVLQNIIMIIMEMGGAP